jgi:hypothetical protein
MGTRSGLRPMGPHMTPFNRVPLLLLISAVVAAANEPANDAGTESDIHPGVSYPRHTPAVTYEGILKQSHSPTPASPQSTMAPAIINMCPPSYEAPLPWREYEFNGMKVYLWPASCAATSR